MIDTILFDLDGTLLPMDQEKFIKEYFTELTKRLSAEGCDPEEVTKVVWAGTKSMMTNDGTRTNREAFFETFSKLSDWDAAKYEPIFDGFYRMEFDGVKRILGSAVGQKEMLRKLRAKNYKIVLATAPVFPRAAVETRLGWVGLKPEDFDYITSYENSHYCKPNPEYYREIFDTAGCDPESCLMIGNNAREDTAAARLGTKIYLVTDYLEKTNVENLDQFPHGDWQSLITYLDELPEVKR